MCCLPLRTRQFFAGSCVFHVHAHACFCGLHRSHDPLSVRTHLAGVCLGHTCVCALYASISTLVCSCRTQVLGSPIPDIVLFSLYCVHWGIFGGSWLAHMFYARFNKVLLANWLKSTLFCRQRSSPLHHHSPIPTQVPYNPIMWATRAVVNFFIVVGVSLAMLWLFALTIGDWGASVSAVVSAQSFRYSDSFFKGIGTFSLNDAPLLFLLLDWRRAPRAFLGLLHVWHRLHYDPVHTVAHALAGHIRGAYEGRCLCLVSTCSSLPLSALSAVTHAQLPGVLFLLAHNGL
jgi:hypothetical protein